MRADAAIVGIGAVAGDAIDAPSLWDSLLRRRSLVERLPDEIAHDLPVRIGCRASRFDPTEALGPKDARRFERFSQLALVAAREAVEQAKVDRVEPHRCAVVVGTGFGGISAFARDVAALEAGVRANPMVVPQLMPNAASALLAMRLGWTGPSTTLSTACASSSQAIGEALELLRRGGADVVLAGGAEAGLARSVINAFASLRALSERNDDPAGASRPFDRDRDGFVLGEGGAFVVLKRMDDALRDGDHVLAAVAGYGATSDAHHLVMPAADGGGAAAAMRAALADAGLAPADVGLVNAHGTSTRLNDAAEAAAIATTFGSSPPVSAIKSTFGHLVAASGALGIVVAVLSHRAGVAPPTVNHRSSDDGVALDVVTEARPLSGAILTNAFGFGGHNVSLVTVPADEAVARSRT